MKKEFSLEDFMLNLKDKLESDGIDLEETPVVFRWRYPSDEEYLFSMMIHKVDPVDEENDEIYRDEMNAYDTWH